MIYMIEPVPKPRMTRRDVWKARPCVLRYRAFADLVRLHILPAQVEGHEKIIFWLPMPKSWPAHKKESMAGEPHRQTPDVDNVAKALLDALFDDDRGMWRLNTEKRWAYDGAIEIIGG